VSEILKITNLSITPKNEPSRLLVNNVSLTLSAGKTTCIVGESGSGKSLTALSIMSLLSKQLQASGNIEFQGQDITRLDEKSLQSIRGTKVGMIFQEPMTSLNPVLTVGYQIGESLTAHLGLKGQALKDKIAALLTQVGIPPERANSYPDELIFITHDFGVVADIADNVVVMFRGEIVETGSKKDVLTKPKHPYTKALLACVPDAEGKKELKPIDYAWLKDGLKDDKAVA
jgi:peptide/nickel transport system ATP-binding protein